MMEWLDVSLFKHKGVSESCVREFYSGIYSREADMDDRNLWNVGDLCININGCDRRITLEEWGSFFKINYTAAEGPYPNDYNAVCWQELTGKKYGQTNKSASSIPSLDDRLCVLFIARTIVCKLQSKSSVMKNDIWVYEHIVNNKPFNLASFMFHRMRNMTANQRARLRYGNLITHFCRQNGSRGFW